MANDNEAKNQRRNSERPLRFSAPIWFGPVRLRFDIYTALTVINVAAVSCL